MKKIFLLVMLTATIGAGCTNPVATPDSLEVVPTASNTVIDMSNQGLSSFPMYLLERTDIEELDVSHNELTGALPAEIRNLERLRVLDASDNQLTGVPAEIGQLAQLEVLDFSNNQLTGLPYELGNLSSLRILDLRGNAVSQRDLEIIRMNLPADVQILE